MLKCCSPLICSTCETPHALLSFYGGSTYVSERAAVAVLSDADLPHTGSWRITTQRIDLTRARSTSSLYDISDDTVNIVPILQAKTLGPQY